MELFLNLCWIALLLPAYTLWRQRVLPNRAARTSLVFSCALGCVLVLLFPVISASDDLHSTGQVMEESKRALRHGNPGNGAPPVAGFLYAALVSPAPVTLALDRAGNIFLFSPLPLGALFVSPLSGRAPPDERLIVVR